MIEITTNTADLLIDVLRDYIFKLTGDEHSDSATHPIEVALLDLLIEKRNEEEGPPWRDPPTIEDKEEE